MRLASSLHRLGEEIVGCYLVEEAGAVTIIDAGVPSYYGAMRTKALTAVGTFDPGTTLDVPGALRVIHTPGHTPGGVAFHAPAHDALFVGDALVTDAVINQRHGPQISPFAVDPDAALASLANIEQLEAHWLLPEHGSPWTGGVAAAVVAARDVGIGHLARPKR